jgi:acetate kinase
MLLQRPKGREMNILLLNAGSSSLKATLMESAGGATLASATGDWAGATTHYQFTGADGIERKSEVAWKGHARAVECFVADLTADQRTSISAVGHRIVHGGPFASSVRITPAIRSRILALAELAPLHNPPSLEALAAAELHLPGVPQVAAFDTAFHATLAPRAYTYPIPQRWTREWNIRRYGFHGLSHAYCAQRAGELLRDRCSDKSGNTSDSASNSSDGRIVICHLGHGCSACAVRAGKSVDTTMGFTPLDGLMMATRCGSIDPSIVLHVQQNHGLTPVQVETALNRESGLQGVSGISPDMRQVLSAATKGNEQAHLALDIYTHRVRQAIGALAVTLGGVDALVFTAGVGEHSAEIRASTCSGLECLGLELDAQKNVSCRPDADVAIECSRGRIFVIATREDVTMLREVVRVVEAEHSQ